MFGTAGAASVERTRNALKSKSAGICFGRHWVGLGAKRETFDFPCWDRYCEITLLGKIDKFHFIIAVLAAASNSNKCFISIQCKKARFRLLLIFSLPS